MRGHTLHADPQNPAHVWASIGIGEILSIATGEVPTLEFESESCTFSGYPSLALEWLSSATVSIATPTPMPEAERWGTPVTVTDEAPPQRESTCAALVSGPVGSILIDCWCDDGSIARIKHWAGAGGLPGAAIVDRLLSLVRDDLSDHRLRDAPLDWGVGTSMADLRMDYRGSPGDVGFSLNGVDVVKFPLTEILAAIGLRKMRPRVTRKGNVFLRYEYWVPRGPMDLISHRAAHGGAFGGDAYGVRLGKVAEKSYAWRIEDVQMMVGR